MSENTISVSEEVLLNAFYAFDGKTRLVAAGPFLRGNTDSRIVLVENDTEFIVCRETQSSFEDCVSYALNIATAIQAFADRVARESFIHFAQKELT